MTGFKMAGALLAAGVMVGCGQPATLLSLTGGHDSPAALALRQSDEVFFGVQSDMDELEVENEEADPSDGLQANKTMTRLNKDGSTTTRTYFTDGSLHVTRVGKNGASVLDESFSAPMAASASVSVPPDAKVLLVKVTYARTPNGSTGSGSLLRAYVQKALFRSESDLTLTTPQGDTVLRTRLAENYVKNHAGHSLVTAKSKRGDYVLDTVLDPQSGVKTGKGKLTRPDGTIVTTTITLNPDKSKVRIMEDTKTQLRTTLNFIPDKSGTGTIENLATTPATQIATIAWDTTGKGQVTYNDGTTKKFRA